MSNDVIEVTAEPTENGERGGAIALHSQPSLSVWDRPVMPSEIEVAGTYQEAGIRPIAVSHMDIFGTLLNNRPIMASGLRVAEMLPGNRPIFFDEVKMLAGEGLPGSRPIMASNPALINAAMLPGNRPIFSNDLGEAPVLMGFID